MRKLILLVALCFGATSHAEVKPEDIIGGIFDIIQDQMNNNNSGTPGYHNDNPGTFAPPFPPGWPGGPGGPGPGPNNPGGNKVILKDNGKNLVMGALHILENGSSDQVNFPACGNKNKRVKALRFRTDNAAVYVNTIWVTFQNNQTISVNVNKWFQMNTASSWFQLGQDRCIKRIQATGQAHDHTNHPLKIYSIMTFVGQKAKPGPGGPGGGNNF